MKCPFCDGTGKLDDPTFGALGVSPTSGGYFNNLSRLRTLGLITYPSPGEARADDRLFPGGAR